MEMKSQKVVNCGRCGSSLRLEGVEYCSLCLCKVVEHRVKKALSKNLASFRDSNGNLAVVIACPDPGSLQCAAAAYLVRRLFGASADIKLINDKGMPRALTGKTASAAADAYRRPNAAYSKAVIMPMCADDLATAFLGLLIDDGSRVGKVETSSPIQHRQSKSGQARFSIGSSRCVSTRGRQLIPLIAELSRCAEAAQHRQQPMRIDPRSISPSLNILESVTEKELIYYAGMKKIKYREKEKGALKLQIQNLQARYPGTVEALARSGRHLLEKD